LTRDDGEEKKAEEEVPKLGFKDFVAISLAALETFLLPLVALAVVIAVFALFFAFRP